MRALLHPYLHHTELISIAVSPDGRHLATGSSTGEDYDAGGDLVIWDIASGRVVNHFRVRGGVGWPDHEGCVQWSPDGARLALAGDTNGILVYEPFAPGSSSLDEVYPTDGWSRPPSFVWGPQSDRVFVSCWRSTSDPRTNARSEPLPEGTIDVPGCVIEVNGDVRWMEPGIPDGAWRGEGTGERHIEPPSTLSWRGDVLFASGSHSQVLCIDLRSRTLRWLSSGAIVAHDPRGQFVAVARGGLVELLDVTGAPLPWATMHVENVLALHWSPDGRRLAVTRADETEDPIGFTLFEVNRGEGTRLLGQVEQRSRARGRWAGDFDPFVWAGDGERFAFLDGDGHVRVWTATAPGEVSVVEVEDAKGLVWGASGRLIAWDSRTLRFIDTGTGHVSTRRLLDLPIDDGPLSDPRLSEFASAQFPVGPVDAREWAVVLSSEQGVAVIAPDAAREELNEVLGWSDGRTSAPLSSQPTRFFDTVPTAARTAPDLVPTAIREIASSGVPPTRWGPSAEPRELFDFYALMELDAAAARDAGDTWRSNWHAQQLASHYHRAGNDAAALKALDALAEPPTQLRLRLECALYCAVRGELDRARRYRTSAEATLFEAAAESSPALCPQWEALAGAVDTLLGTESRSRIERAQEQLEEESNPGEVRARLMSSWLAVGDHTKALAFAGDVERFAPLILRDAKTSTLAQYDTLVERLARDDFETLYAAMEGYAARGAWDEGLAALARFDGLSTTETLVDFVREAITRDPVTGMAFLARAHEHCDLAEERLELAGLAARLDPVRSKRWAEADEAEAPRVACKVYGALGDTAGVLRLAAASPEARFPMLLAALEGRPELWSALGSHAIESIPEEVEADQLATLAGLAHRAQDTAQRDHLRALANQHVALDRHWELAKTAAALFTAGDDEGAFLLLSRLPRSKRSYAIPEAAMAVAQRIAHPTLGEPVVVAYAALYSLLAALPAETLGTGGRAFETSRALRIIEKWPRAEHDGTLG